MSRMTAPGPDRSQDPAGPSIAGTLTHMDKVTTGIEERVTSIENALGIRGRVDNAGPAKASDTEGLLYVCGRLSERMHAINCRLVEVGKAIGGMPG